MLYFTLDLENYLHCIFRQTQRARESTRPVIDTIDLFRYLDKLHFADCIGHKSGRVTPNSEHTQKYIYLSVLYFFGWACAGVIKSTVR